MDAINSTNEYQVWSMTNLQGQDNLNLFYLYTYREHLATVSRCGSLKRSKVYSVIWWRCMFIGELLRSRRSTTGKKIWLSTHPLRNFGSKKIVGTYVCKYVRKSTHSWQPEWCFFMIWKFAFKAFKGPARFGGKSYGHHPQASREKKNTKPSLSFD